MSMVREDGTRWSQHKEFKCAQDVGASWRRSTDCGLLVLLTPSAATTPKSVNAPSPLVRKTSVSARGWGLSALAPPVRSS